MSNYLTLVKVQLLSLFGINKALHTKTKKEKSRLVKTAAIGVLVTALLFGVSIFYNFLFAEALKMTGLSFSLLIGAMFAASSLITFMTTVYKTNGTIFGFKDYDIIMSLPIKKSSVIAAKLTFLYIVDLAFVFVAMLPSGIFFGINQGVSFWFYPLYIFAMLFVPLIPMSIGLYLGALITYITSRFKRANYLTIFFYIVFLGGIMALSYSSPSEQQYLDMLTILNSIYPLTKLFVSAVTYPSLPKLFLFLFGSATLSGGLIYLLGIGFERINTAILTKKTGAKYSLSKSNQKGAVSALFKKEIRRFVASPMYVMNSAVGALLTLLFSGYMFFSRGQSSLSSVMPLLIESLPVATFMIPIFLLLILSITTSTTCAISLEGKSFWILKSSPLQTADVLLGKLLVGNVIMLPAALIGAVLTGISFSAGLSYYLFSAAVLVSAVTMTSAFGLWLNLKYPKFDWENELRVIKQSMPVFVNMIFGMLYTTALGVATFFAYKYLGVSGIAAVGAFSVLVSAAVHYLLFTDGVKLYDNIDI